MHENAHNNEPLPLHIAALRVPARWLRDEIEAGRLPALRAGRAILIHAIARPDRASPKTTNGDPIGSPQLSH